MMTVSNPSHRNLLPMTIQEKVNRLSLIGLEWMGPDEQYLIGDAYQSLPDIEPMTDDEFEAFFLDIAPKVPTVIDKSITVIRQGSVVLREHEITIAKAQAVGRKIKTAWATIRAMANGPDKWEAMAKLDDRTQKFMVNCRDRLKERKEARAALTQLMAKIAAMFTAQENMIDPTTKEGLLVKELQGERDQYVKDLAVERKRQEAEALKAKEKTQAAVGFRSQLTLAFNTALINYQTKVKTGWQKAFNEITLENYEEKKANLAIVKAVFPDSRRDEILAIDKAGLRAMHHTIEEIEVIYQEVYEAHPWMQFSLTYGSEMSDFKKDLQDRLPSKLAELQETKRLADEAAENKRKADEAAAAAAAEKDQKRKEELQRQADEKQRIANEKEQERLQQVADQQQREQEGNLQLEQERQQQQQTAETTAHLQKTAGEAQAAFDFAKSTSMSSEAPRVRTMVLIKVLNHAGWVEVFTRWYEKEGVTLDVSKWEKKTLGSMKKDLEAIANKARKDNKTDEIVSKNLIYEEDLKVTNVREKEEN